MRNFARPLYLINHQFIIIMCMNISDRTFEYNTDHATLAMILFPFAQYERSRGVHRLIRNTFDRFV